MNKNHDKTLSAQLHIANDRLVSVAAIVGIFCLCAGIYPLSHSFIGRVFASDFGILSNLTLILLLISVGIVVTGLKGRCGEIQKRLIQNWASGLKLVAPDLGLILLCLLLCGESVNWLLPISEGGKNPQTLVTIKDILAAAFRDVPEKMELSQAMVIAGARLAFILGPLYLLGFLVVRYQTVIKTLESPENADTLIYAGAFIPLVILSVAIAAFENKSLEIFEKGSNLGQAVCIMLYLLKTKKLPPASESSSEDIPEQ